MTTEPTRAHPTGRPVPAPTGPAPAAAPLDEATAAALQRELDGLAVENTTTNAKAGVVLTLDGILVAAVAALGKVPAPALALVVVGTVATVVSAVLAVLAVKPQLKTASGTPYGFPRWADRTEAELLQDLRRETRPRRLIDLSALCLRKMRLLAASAVFGVLAIVAVSAAGVAAAL